MRWKMMQCTGVYRKILHGAAVSMAEWWRVEESAQSIIISRSQNAAKQIVRECTWFDHHFFPSLILSPPLLF